MHICPVLYKGSCLPDQSDSLLTMLGINALLILHASLGLVFCNYYFVSTEKYQDLNTGAGEDITEVEGYGPSGPVDQSRLGPAPVPIEVRPHFVPPLVGSGEFGGNLKKLLTYLCAQDGKLGIFGN